MQGAQVTSWRPAGAEDVVFLSKHAVWKEGRAIRGGIPICFPWFRGKADNPSAPAHGFVRTRQWNLDSISANPDGSVTVLLSIRSDESTRQWWPHDFLLIHRITIGTVLLLELSVTNNGTDTFSFEEALHTYFAVGDVHSVRVLGLDGVTYLDNTDGNREKLQAGDLTISAPTDDAFINTQASVDLFDPIKHRILRTEKGNSNETVIWNPWESGAATLTDLGSGEWEQMLCAEASNILGSAVSLPSGKQHSMRAMISLLQA
jgi:glucose-6-phosphate 1-epimerase